MCYMLHKTLNSDNYFLKQLFPNKEYFLLFLHLRQSSNKFLELVHEMISTWSHARRSTSETATSTTAIAIVAAAARYKIKNKNKCNECMKLLT